MPDPRRGEIWLADFGDPIGHQAGSARSALVVSDDRANQRGLVIACPITRTKRGYPTHVEIEPGNSGLDETSYLQGEQVRTMSTARLLHRLGHADVTAVHGIERVLRLLLRL